MSPLDREEIVLPRPLKESKGSQEKGPPPSVVLPSSSEVQDLDLSVSNPDGSILIACIFPQGQEKNGQRFASKLKIAGSKKVPSVEIQTVFTHGWAVGQVNLSAWKQSAHLSGADYMFVLISKKDQGVLGKVSNSSGEKMKCRVVYFEQLDLWALYADILAEMNRSHNGQH